MGQQPVEKQHEWKLEDDMLALYLYKVEQEKKIDLTQKDIDELAQAFGISAANMKARIENYKYLDGKDGLANDPKQVINDTNRNYKPARQVINVPEQARQIWDAYWDLSAESLMERLTGRR